MRKVDAPVTSSPAITACCTGAAPRQAGSSEKCRLTQPRAGTSSATLGSSAPYATTGQQSGAISRSRARKSSSRGRPGLSTSIPACSARWATGLASSFRPRPAVASGRVTTATTSCRSEASRASSAGTAASGVPAKTSLIVRGCLSLGGYRGVALVRTSGGAGGRARAAGQALTGRGRTCRAARSAPAGRPLAPLGLADRLHRRLALLGVEPVDEDDPVEVVGLVLDAARQPLRALDGDRVAVHVEALGDDAVRAQAVVGQSGQRQAAFGAVLLVLAEGQLGVDQVAEFAVHVVGEHPQGDAELRRGQAGARAPPASSRSSP